MKKMRRKDSDGMRNIWLDGVMGVVVGDALGCPVQFENREVVRSHRVTTMRGHGTFDLPAGSWTDDSSMTLALLASIREKQGIDLEDIMDQFVRWLIDGEYTPYGYSYDIGGTTMDAVLAYKRFGNTEFCGRTSPASNGNGSLMRIMPACLYAYANRMDDDAAVQMIHQVGGLTHNHLRSRIACGLYYFCVRQILDGEGSLLQRVKSGVEAGFAWYDQDPENKRELTNYQRLRDIEKFAHADEDEISGSGYVVDTLHAAIWSLITTDSYEACELKAVNLGLDTDTVAAIAGGLAGLYYGYEGIPEDWLKEIKRRDWIEELCECVIGDGSL